MIVKILTTPTCVPCKVLAKRLDDCGIEYTKLNALEHPEYNVKSTPHIIVEKDRRLKFKLLLLFFLLKASFGSWLFLSLFYFDGCFLLHVWTLVSPRTYGIP